MRRGNLSLRQVLGLALIGVLLLFYPQLFGNLMSWSIRTVVGAAELSRQARDAPPSTPPQPTKAPSERSDKAAQR
jgi:hypothetical protein